jgi:hypothetical protein
VLRLRPERLCRLVAEARPWLGAEIAEHVAHVLSKLGLRDRVQAVILCYESGIVVPGGAV